MNSFFSNRFQRLFSGDLQQRRKRTILNAKNENTEPKTEGFTEPVGSNYDEDHEKNLTDGNHLPNEKKQIKKNNNE